MPFGALQDRDFFGRGESLAVLSQRLLREGDKPRSMMLAGPLGIGKTELLKQLFGYLFWKQDSVVPFYYTVSPSALSAIQFSRDYLTRFLCQRLAFERKEQSLAALEGLSLDGLYALVEERGAAWAREILDRFTRSADDHHNALRIAIGAPRASVIASGVPAVILIDEFHRLKDLHTADTSGRDLVSLFETGLSFRKTPYVITGNTAAINELTVARGIERMPLPPLGVKDAASMAESCLRSQGAEGAAPLDLLRYLGGNPFYLSSVFNRAGVKKNPGEKDFRKACAREVIDGAIARSWTAALKEFVSGLDARNAALTIAQKIHQASEPLSLPRIEKTLALTAGKAEEAAYALHLAGVVRGEFGVFSAGDDSVLRDVIDSLYQKEILGKSARDLEETFLARLTPEREDSVRFAMTLPMVKDAELVAAQCIEQIGKNLALHQDAVGQMQIAVIEACINAIEHSKAAERKIYLSIEADAERMEVWIESAGREFIPQEHGEPFSGPDLGKGSGRGWGIKLMKRFVDEVRFEKTARGTKTVLVKTFTATAGVEKEEPSGRE